VAQGAGEEPAELAVPHADQAGGHARSVCVKLMDANPLAHLLWGAIQRLRALRGPPLLLRG
jgi:hypothetical protein